MPFVRRLRPEQIVVNPGWHGFGPTVDGLLDRLAVAGRLSPDARAEAAAAVRARESEASTAILEIGVGVPHARIGSLRDPCVAFAVAAGGLYEPAPTVPIRIVALVLSPATALEEHLRTLADIATLLHSADLRSRLLRAGDPAGILDVLVQHAREIP